MTQNIMGNGGELLGVVQINDNGRSKLYYKPGMRLVARVITEDNGDQRTYDASSRFIGYGDLGVLEL